MQEVQKKASRKAFSTDLEVQRKASRKAFPTGLERQIFKIHQVVVLM